MKRSKTPREELEITYRRLKYTGRIKFTAYGEQDLTLKDILSGIQGSKDSKRIRYIVKE